MAEAEVTVRSSPTQLTIELIGRVVAKKNSKRQFISPKTGKLVTTYGAAQEDLDRLAKQLPAYLWDLGLVHPDIRFEFFVASGAIDRDNSITTILDLMVKYGILQNDSVAQCNGNWDVRTALYSEINKTVITLTDHGKDLWPKRPKKKRSAS